MTSRRNGFIQRATRRECDPPHGRSCAICYLRAFSRQWSLLYTLSVDAAQATVAPTQPQDLLAYFLLRKASGAELAVKLWLDSQLAQHQLGP